MIVAAAIKLNGRVYGLPAPARHHNIIHMLAKRGFEMPVDGVQGFIDDELGFLERPQALHRAIDEGQSFKREPAIQLNSEDLW